MQDARLSSPSTTDHQELEKEICKRTEASAKTSAKESHLIKTGEGRYRLNSVKQTWLISKFQFFAKIWILFFFTICLWHCFSAALNEKKLLERRTAQHKMSASLKISQDSTNWGRAWTSPTRVGLGTAVVLSLSFTKKPCQFLCLYTSKIERLNNFVFILLANNTHFVLLESYLPLP